MYTHTVVSLKPAEKPSAPSSNELVLCSLSVLHCTHGDSFKAEDTQGQGCKCGIIVDRIKGE
jgi:hypothetical protein